MSLNLFAYAEKYGARVGRCFPIAFAILMAPISAVAEPLVLKVPAWSQDGRPQLTLPQALLMAREARERNPNAGSIIIELGAGIHRLTKPLEFTEKDSGTAANPLIVRSAPGAVVRLLGSRPVPSRNAQYLLEGTKEYWEVLPANARSKVRVINLNQNELTRGEPQRLTFQQRIAPIGVFQKTRSLVMARWPNNEYERSQRVTAQSTKDMGPQFAVPPGKAAAWSREHGLWAAGYWAWDWFFETAPVSAIDAKQGLVTLFPLKFLDPVRPGLRYFIYNALSELDAPGEYVVDWQTRRLIIWPYDDDLTRNPIEIASAEHLLDMRGVKHVRIEGIAFENTRGDAVQIKDSSDIAIEDCLVANVGGNGIHVEGGQDVRIVRSVIADTGEGGVILSGGDRAALTAARHAVRDSVFVRFGHLARTLRPAIKISGVGQIVEGSYFFDASHIAIIFSGNDHRITGNEITRVMLETSDAGAIYAGRDWTARGTIVAENYLHDIVAMPGMSVDGKPYEVKGVYLDDLFSGTTVRRNLFANVMLPVFIGGGRDNEVTGNIFLRPVVAAVHVDDRGLNWYAPYIADANSDLRRNLSEISYQAEPYRSRYPGLANILNDEPGSPKNNRIGPNIVLGGQPYEIPSTLMRLQQFGAVLNERTAGFGAPPGPIAPRTLAQFSAENAKAFAPPFDLPFAKMDRKSALKDLKYINRATAD